MKNFLFILFVLLLALSAYGKNSTVKDNAKEDDSLIIPSNGETSNINISSIVAAQIKQAHKKQLDERQKKKTAVAQTLKVKPVKAETHSLITLPNFFNKLSDTGMKVLILLFASIIAASVVFIRRKKYSRKSTTNQTLKNNIKLLREERIFVKQNPKLSDVRNSLGSSPSLYNNGRESILKVARELNISQGEIFLAAKIKAHELGSAYLTKQYE
jgi:hypothetical protein